MATVRVYLGGGSGAIDIPLPPGFGSAYALMSIDASVATTSCPTVSTPVVITAGWVASGNVPQNGVTANTGNGTLTVAAAGIYEVNVNLSLNTPNNANDRWQFQLYKNGNAVRGLKAINKIDLTTDYVSAAFSGLVNCAAGDVLDVRVTNLISNTATIIVSDAGFSAVQVG